MASLVLYWSVMIACYLLASRLRRYADRLGFVNTLLSIRRTTSASSACRRCSSPR